MRDRIGFTCSSFDLLHAGHILMLKECKEQCDLLVVGLQSDPTIDRPHTKNKPVQTFEERRLMIESIRHVDKVIPYDTEADLIDLLNELKPNIRFLGEDWKGKDFTGMDLSIKVVYNSRKHHYSTSELRNRVYQAERIKHEIESKANAVSRGHSAT